MTLDDYFATLVRDATKLAIRDEVPAIIREHLARLEQAQESVRASEHDPALSTKAAAHYAGVSEPTIRARVASGELRAIRPGRVIKIRRSDLDAFLARSSPRGEGVIDLSARAREILSSARRSND
jgi:excisionase family DNA binding protein